MTPYILKRNILKSIIEQKFLRIMFSTIFTFHFSLNDPTKELRGQPLKCLFFKLLENNKEFLNSVEQNLFEISRPFSQFNVKGASPLN